MGREVHIKDKRLPGGWAFYGFDEAKPTTPFPHEMELLQLPRAARRGGHDVCAVLSDADQAGEKKGTLSEAYKKEEGKK